MADVKRKKKFNVVQELGEDFLVIKYVSSSLRWFIIISLTVNSYSPGLD